VFAESGARPEGAAAVDVSDLVRLRQLLEAVNSGERFLTFGETLSLLAARLGKIVPYDSLALYVPRGGRLVPVYTAGNQRAQLAALMIPMGHGVSGWAMKTNHPIVNGNPVEELAGAASAMAAPLGGAGVLTLYGQAFHAEDLQVISSFSAELASYVGKNSGEMAGSEMLMDSLKNGPLAAASASVMVH